MPDRCGSQGGGILIYLLDLEKHWAQAICAAGDLGMRGFHPGEAAAKLDCLNITVYVCPRPGAETGRNTLALCVCECVTNFKLVATGVFSFSIASGAVFRLEVLHPKFIYYGDSYCWHGTKPLFPVLTCRDDIAASIVSKQPASSIVAIFLIACQVTDYTMADKQR